MASSVDLSIVVPVFNEEATLEYSHKRIATMLAQFPNSELIYVNDGSRDRTQEILLKLRSPQVRALEFSRNFGHSAAVLAGLEASRGSRIAILDADLQDPPELIPEMLKVLGEGYDVVYGQRARRKGESVLKCLSAWFFYRFLNTLTGFEIPKDTGDFRVMTREVCDAVLDCQETEPFLRGLVAWVGFKQKAFMYVRDERLHGVTKYPWRKMLRFGAFAVVSFSSTPLRIAGYLGAIGMLGCAVATTWALVGWWQGHVVTGWTSVILVVTLTQSLTLAMIGLLGIYVGRVHAETQRRPKYVVRKN